MPMTIAGIALPATSSGLCNMRPIVRGRLYFKLCIMGDEPNLSLGNMIENKDREQGRKKEMVSYLYRYCLTSLQARLRNLIRASSGGQKTARIA